MPYAPASSAGGLTKLFDSTLGASALSIDSGAAGFATTFDVLYIDILARTDEVATFSTLTIIFNNDSGAHYDESQDKNRNTTFTGVAVTANGNLLAAAPGSSAAANFAASVRLTVAGYAQTTFFKTCEATHGFASSAATGQESATSIGTWESTAAISRVKIAVAGGANLVAGSRLLIRAS